jgi:hypothetical protein
MRRVALLLLVVVAAGGCAARALPPAGEVAAVSPRKASTETPPPRVPGPARSDKGWEKFPAVREALVREIGARAEALRQGPVGGRAKELAGLRLCDAGFELVAAGSLAAARESFEKGLSLHGANGYAYLGLAYVHHLQGRFAQAGEFAAGAGRYLPRQGGAGRELEALKSAIAAGAARS